MAKWYVTRWHDSNTFALGGPEIEEVEVLKSTSSSVWVGSRRKSMRSEYENYFETREEAVAFIVATQEAKIAQHESNAASHRKVLAKFKK